jgi:superoxide dismutase
MDRITHGSHHNKYVTEVNDVFLNLYLTHGEPKNLLVNEIVRIGSGALSAVSNTQVVPKMEAGAGATNG